MNYGIQDVEVEEISEEDRAELDEFRRHLPKDIAVSIEEQRVFSEECMKRAGDFGRFQWLACIFIVLGADCSALITQCL